MRRPEAAWLAGLCLGAAVLAAGCGPRAEEDVSDLDRLVSWMTGSFSSAAQAREDPAFFDIRLHMAPVWNDRTDGRWLYVEQSVAAATVEEERPYRQRVYRIVEPEPGRFESRVHELPDPDAAVGAWREEAPLADLSPADLVPRAGCTVYLAREEDGVFRGRTADRTCASDLRGAAWASSEVEVTASGIVSWDRGFDAEGRQVWGARTGGYVFLRER